ncbi:adenosylmethionine decarboxylase [Cardiobacterium valvarum]|uniref:S-adenosylmethionine decarboxylase proenzyme n=1 Tax=Cardiobacterium valvarum TaxID=194702 RepID=A0A381E998_9GAMM|nr:adenosylmethionine decarboxylase [Cardiobacterium valvarum]SUX23241.1 S-adenosylmethionine decarboxylase proenzyme precursor [Cardiobacterium valvarum]
MAQILTSLKKSKMTVGEKRFAQLLSDYLDDDYLVWYNVATSGSIRRYPDFLIFHPGHGLWCLEIKDWHMGNIKGMDKEHVILKSGDQRITIANPLEQARGCCLPIIDRMKKDRRLRHANGKYQGKLRFPWAFGAVMCNWQRSRISEAARTLLEDCFPPHLTWYKEDIEAGGLERNTFLAKLHAMQPFRPLELLTDGQSERVRAHIYPEFIIDESQKRIFEVEPDHDDIIHIMDARQEELARKLGEGHRVIHGVAGSGKTIILQHRARQLAAENPDKPILIICYNIMLASLLRARLAGVPHLEIHHFHEWCGEMKNSYGISVPLSNNYPEALANATCTAVANGQIPGGQYHAVLIDEGHDFAEDWLRALTTMPEGADAKEQRLLFLYDDAQNLYFPKRRGLDFSLKSVGIQAQGRTDILNTNYRNSEEICRYADDFKHRFMDDTPITVKDDMDIFTPEEDTTGTDEGVPTVAVEAGGEHSGYEPEFLRFASRGEEIKAIIAQIHAWHAEGVPYGDIAVLCHTNKQCEALANTLGNAGIPLQNPVSSADRKNYRPDPQRLLVCTIHSSKGGEFPRVIVASIDNLPDNSEEQQQQNARLLYVGMTRAQHYLCLTATGENTYTRYLPQTVVDAPRHITGTHALLDCYGCDAALLGNAGRLENILREAAQAAGANILAAHFHHFGAGAGVTGVLLLAESHLSIHTWPEHRFAALDVYLCSGDIARARRMIEAALRPAHSDWRAFPRGYGDKEPS